VLGCTDKTPQARWDDLKLEFRQGVTPRRGQQSVFPALLHAILLGESADSACYLTGVRQQEIAKTGLTLESSVRV